MFVKICGITNLSDARHAAEAGADAVGLIFAESPRRIEPSTARDIVAALPGAVLTVGVFRRQRPDRILEVVRRTGVSAVQVHDAELGDLERLRSKLPMLLESVRPEGAASAVVDSPADLVLVDAAAPGGGVPFDWRVLDDVAKDRLVLAGGLTPDTVGGAVSTVRPYGVDVASGVEDRPGRKDPEKVRRFVEQARAAAGG